MKHCPNCGLEKPLSEFRTDKRKKSGVGSYCKPCASEKGRKYKAKRLALQGDALRKKFVAVERKRLYGITQEQFDEMKNNQNNLCAICKNELDHGKNTCVDHCHTTNKVRGILCAKCNFGLGQFNDSIQRLKSAIDYILHHETCDGQINS
jgi:adenine-specific DNA methylase